MRSTSYTLGFAAVVCVACSLVVSSAATLLKERQARNVQVDRQKTILRAVGYFSDPKENPTADAIETMYKRRITGYVIDKDGRIVGAKTPADLDPAVYLDPFTKADQFPLYVCNGDDDKPVAYVFPVVGKGLWSTLYGYMALAPDAVTLKGLSFYQQKETPGLGAEIEKPWFQKNFVGKKVLDASGRLRSITVVKGKVADLIAPEDAAHYVDGISGASITSKGVTRLVRAGLERYDPLFKKIRKRGSLQP